MVTMALLRAGVRHVTRLVMALAFVIALPGQFADTAAVAEHHHGFHCVKATADHPKGTPCRIIIKAIGVDATVIKLGLNSDGTLQVPTDFSQTGWWSGGTLPGRVGPALIVGHVDSVQGPAVFYHLKELKAGAVATVYRYGMRLPVRFAVQWQGEYPKIHFPTKLVYGAIPYAGLRLVTCGGVFNHATGHYLDNVIVFAKLIH
jgi:hypothetical protein